MWKMKDIRSKIKRELLKNEVFDCLKRNIINAKTPKRKKIKKKIRHKNKKIKKVRFVTPKYKDYIKSKSWRKRKNEYYKKHKKECIVCKSKWRVGLHHISYKNLGREEDEDLVPLCWGCHADYHEKYGVKADNQETNEYIIENQEIIEFNNIMSKIS